MAGFSEKLIEKLVEMTRQFEAIEQQLSDPEVVSNPDKLRELSIKRAAIGPIAEKYGHYRSLQQQITECHQVIEEGDDGDLVELAQAELPDLEEQAEKLLEEIANEFVTSDDAAIGSVMLELRAGTGGAEAAIWAGDLLDMYQKFAGSRRWKFEMLSMNGGEMGGVRHAVVNVKGEGVWQGLGYEGGVHCVKRVPATEAQGRVHTSTATVAVLPEPETVEISIPAEDVDEHITTSQGPGGQNVNKVATAVHLIHKPTGIEVRMQESKSQRQNRDKGWALLRARVFDHYQRQKDAERAEERSKMIGSGGRSERIRTYRYKDNIAVDHRLGRSFGLQGVLAGDLDELIEALMVEDRAQRLAAL